MSSTDLVTDAELSRARADPAFRHQLVSESLDLLLGRLNQMRGSESDEKCAREIRDAVKLAVKLADLLQRTATEQASARAAGAGNSLPFHRNAV